MRRSIVRASQAAFLAIAVASPSFASFHLMQIEQAVGGVCGGTSRQAIQLRMRAAGQNLVSGKRLVARDATGANPVILLTFPSNVTTSSAGSRILAASADFNSHHTFTPDFTLSNLIPASYLAAGRLTFEDEAGNVYWSLAWGGASYTGSHAGTLDNDPDGNFGPAFFASLPSTPDVALRFAGAASAMSTNNAADYSLSESPATFTRNDGGTVLLDCIFFDGFESGDSGVWSSTIP